MKNNHHKKLYRPDYFGWRYYCFGARLRHKRYDKHMAKKIVRRWRRASCRADKEEDNG